MNIYEKLLAIQCELKAPKSQYNSFGKYNYRNCEDILEAVKPLCKKYNVVLRMDDDIIYVEGRHYVRASAQLTDCDKPEFSVGSRAFAREEAEKKGMDGSQVTGASSSYARKYALNALFDIDDTKDSDTTNRGDEGETKPKTSHTINESDKSMESSSEKEKPVTTHSMSRSEAEEVSFASGKLAGVRFGDMPRKTLEWIVDKMDGKFNVAATVILNAREQDGDTF